MHLKLSLISECPAKLLERGVGFFATFFARLAAVELETIEKFYSQFLVWPISLISTRECDQLTLNESDHLLMIS